MDPLQQISFSGSGSATVHTHSRLDTRPPCKKPLYTHTRAMAAAAASSSSSSATLCKHHGPPTASRRRLRVCVAISVTALLLAAVVAAAVLAVAAARPRPADATVTALRLASLSVSPGGSVNATLDAVLAIRNPSPVAAFAHDAGRAEVYYRGALAATPTCRPGASRRAARRRWPSGSPCSPTASPGARRSCTATWSAPPGTCRSRADDRAGHGHRPWRVQAPRGGDHGVRRRAQRAPAGRAQLVLSGSHQTLAICWIFLPFSVELQNLNV